MKKIITPKQFICFLFFCFAVNQQMLSAQGLHFKGSTYKILKALDLDLPNYILNQDSSMNDKNKAVTEMFCLPAENDYASAFRKETFSNLTLNLSFSRPKIQNAKLEIVRWFSKETNSYQVKIITGDNQNAIRFRLYGPDYNIIADETGITAGSQHQIDDVNEDGIYLLNVWQGEDYCEATFRLEKNETFDDHY